jgi:hypothetical protein
LMVVQRSCARPKDLAHLPLLEQTIKLRRKVKGA